MRDLHHIPIRITRHAAEALIKRFKLDVVDAEHYIRIARTVKPIEKDGNIGRLESRIGDRRMLLICTIRDDVLYIITVEECN